MIIEYRANYSIKFFYLRTVLTYRVFTPHFGNLRNSILPYAMS